MPGSGYTVALRHFLYKDCFSLNCEKLLLVRGKKSFPRAELKRARRVPRWPSLCECWAVEVLKKRQVSYELKWWMAFIVSSARITTKYLQSKRERLVSVREKFTLSAQLGWDLVTTMIRAHYSHYFHNRKKKKWILVTYNPAAIWICYICPIIFFFSSVTYL